MRIPKKQPTLSDQVEQAIYEYIRKHRLLWDDPLPKEEELAAELDVSRTVVREALSRLKAAGVIESRRRRGMVLTKPDFFTQLEKLIRFGLLDTNSQQEFAVLRVVLEIGLADLVYRNRNAKTIAELEEIAEQFHAPELDTAKRNELETRFHTALFELSGNEVIAGFQTLLVPLFLDCMKDAKIQECGEFHDHRKLVAVLKNGTIEEWRDAVRQHLNTYLS